MKQLTDFEQKVLSDTISKYGYDPQIDMAIEEMSELTKALLKFRRTVKYSKDNPEPKRQNVLEEIADVEILLHQLKLIFDFRQEDVDKIVEFKLRRQYDRLNYSDAPRVLTKGEETMKTEKNNPFDLIEEPEIPIDISQANYQWYVINYPKFYCEDVCKSMYHRRCSNQCEKCLNAIIDHHSQNS